MPDHPFGLSESPFADGHDPRFIYSAERRVEGVALLRKRIDEGESFVVVTGDPGSGKTSVVTETLEAADLLAEVASIAHPSLTPAELLEAVCIEFGAPLPNPPSKPQALASLEHHLRDLRQGGIAAVLVLDEAHGLKTELLEEVRLLSNMKAEGRGLLQCILVGMPELERRLGLPELTQLRQRIGLHLRLAPLNEEETECYIHHRVGAAGGDGPTLFPPETCHEVHNYTNGLPRDINTLAGHALEQADAAGAPSVTIEHVRIAAGDARPRGIATAARATGGSQPFELRRKSVPGRAVAEPPRAPNPPVVAPAPPPKSELRKPPSFLWAQQKARSDESDAPRTGAAQTPTLEERFRSGELDRGEFADDGRGTDAPSEHASRPRSEIVQELGATVFLVGLLVVMLLATGHWDPVARTPETSTGGAAAGGTPKTEAFEPPGLAGTVPAPATMDPETPLPLVQERRPAPTASEPDGDRPLRPAYGFEVGTYSHADSAAAVLKRIMRGSKLPVRVVTKSSGNPYRVVVGPFVRRRDAEKAIHELFRSGLVERARLVQIPK